MKYQIYMKYQFTYLITLIIIDKINYFIVHNVLTFIKLMNLYIKIIIMTNFSSKINTSNLIFM
jgi:hypothetical protein